MLSVPAPVAALPSRSRPFRAHTSELAAELSPAAAGDLFAQLSRDWVRLCSLTAMRHTLSHWARQEPALDGFDGLAGLLDTIDLRSGEQEDALLLALVRLSQAGHELAGRVLLQAMLPKLATFVRRTRPGGDDGQVAGDRQQSAVAAFWEVLHAYPAHRRPRTVAGNLALDTLHRLTAEQRRPAREVLLSVGEPPDRCTFILDRTTPAQAFELERGVDLDGQLTADADLLEVIAWALEHQVLDPDEAALLVRVYLPDPGEGASGSGQAALAQQLGLSHAALRQRCSRARRRLITAVQAGDAAPDADPVNTTAGGGGQRSGLGTTAAGPVDGTHHGTGPSARAGQRTTLSAAGV